MRTSPAWRHATTPAELLDALASVAAAAQQTVTDNGRFRDAWLRLSRAVFTHGVPD